MGNAASTPAAGSPALNKNSAPSGECPMSPKTLPVIASSTSLSAAVEAAKCPISGQEAKNGQTCAYDPTKMSFWQSKAIAAALPPKPVEVQSQVIEECPMRAKSSTTANAGEKSVNSFVNAAADPKYKNPNMYNVSDIRVQWNHYIYSCLKAFRPAKPSRRQL